ncbi:hypothetical protein LguiA_022555 [Lonicera macranthoides]
MGGCVHPYGIKTSRHRFDHCNCIEHLNSQSQVSGCVPVGKDHNRIGISQVQVSPTAGDVNDPMLNGILSSVSVSVTRRLGLALPIFFKLIDASEGNGNAGSFVPNAITDN